MNEKIDAFENKQDEVLNKLVKKFEEILQKDWKDFSLKKKPSGKFEYNWRELWAWIVFQNSEVWDYDIWEWTYCVSLGDLAVYPDFLAAVQEISRDEWIEFYVTESISLNDCLCIAWRQSIDFLSLAHDLWIKDDDAINPVLLKIKNELAPLLKPNFQLKINPIERRFFLKLSWMKRLDVIDKTPSFIENLKIITEYFDNHMDEIKQSLKEIALDEQKKNDEIKKEQSNQLDSLQKQL